MRRKWNILRNLYTIYKNLKTIETCAVTMQDYGTNVTPLDEAPDEVLSGVNDMSNMHRILTVPHGEFAKDIKTLKRLWHDVYNI